MGHVGVQVFPPQRHVVGPESNVFFEFQKSDARDYKKNGRDIVDDKKKKNTFHDSWRRFKHRNRRAFLLIVMRFLPGETRF